jgi:hypothetical protein
LTLRLASAVAQVDATWDLAGVELPPPQEIPVGTPAPAAEPAAEPGPPL